MRVGIIDYEAGNLRSVETALSHLGVDYFVTDIPEEVKTADRLIFPGVGEAGAAMKALVKRGLDRAIIDYIASGRYFLGICIGCQLLLEESEESSTPCLGFFPGRVRKFEKRNGFKVPHMGWNEAVPIKDGPLFEDISAGANFYFVHSYYPDPSDEKYALCETDYMGRFVSGMSKDNVFAVQFHPEKSGPEGLKLLDNFFKIRDPI